MVLSLLWVLVGWLGCAVALEMVGTLLEAAAL